MPRWYKREPGLRHHWKTRNFAGILREAGEDPGPTPEAWRDRLIGIALEDEAAADGILVGWTPAKIAASMGWTGDPAALVAALIGCGGGDGAAGWLDRRTGEEGTIYEIHGWEEFNGLHLKAAQRMRKWRESQGQQDPERPSRMCHNVTSRNTTQRHVTADKTRQDNGRTDITPDQGSTPSTEVRFCNRLIMTRSLSMTSKSRSARRET